MNKIMLIGNLTRDPELTVTNSGLPYCRFSLAVSRRFANSEGVREADFIPVIVWRNQAENCHKFLKKGSKAAVSGSLQVRNYETSSGEKRTAFEVIADDVEFVGARVSGDSDDTAISKPANEDSTSGLLEAVDDGDLPF